MTISVFWKRTLQNYLWYYKNPTMKCAEPCLKQDANGSSFNAKLSCKKYFVFLQYIQYLQKKMLLYEKKVLCTSFAEKTFSQREKLA